MTDRIEIRDLRLKGRIGVTDEERSQDQLVVVNITVEADLFKAGVSDELADTVNYGSIISDVAELVRSTEANLLEHLAEKIAARISPLSGVIRVTVDVAKEQPPVTEDVGSVAVRIERSSG